MPKDSITLDKSAFKALSSDTRVAVLKALDERRKTASELAKELSFSVQSVSEHLAKLEEAGLAVRAESERKWVYYELTDKGRAVLHPDSARGFWVLLGLSAIAFVAALQRPATDLLTAPAMATAPASLGERAYAAMPSAAPLASPASSVLPPAAAAPMLDAAAKTAVAGAGQMANESVQAAANSLTVVTDNAAASALPSPEPVLSAARSFGLSPLEQALVAVAVLLLLAAVFVRFKRVTRR